METTREKQAGGKKWNAFCPRRGQDSNEVIAYSGISFHLWRLYQHFWLVCLLFPLVSLVKNPTPLVHLVTGVCALVFFAISYTWLMWRHPIERGGRTHLRIRLQLMLFTLLVALVLLLSLIYGLTFLWLFIGVSALAGVLLPLRSALLVVTLLMLLPPVISVVINGGVEGVDWPLTIALLLLVRGLGLDMLGLLRLSSAIRELHTTRRELARLEVEEERLRLARDMHDLLGHTLSLITLKGELAGSLVTENPERCTQELSEIVCVSRQMLREVRKTVAGYRQPTVASELDGAKQLLEAAGVAYMVEQTIRDLPPAIDAILAWTVREGVTNVIRHSHARQCRIQLRGEQEMVYAEVINDGEGQEEKPEQRINQGHGLSGLRERITALGGTLEAGPLVLSGSKHFRLWVALPMPSYGETGEAAGTQEGAQEEWV